MRCCYGESASAEVLVARLQLAHGGLRASSVRVPRCVRCFAAAPPARAVAGRASLQATRSASEGQRACARRDSPRLFLSPVPLAPSCSSSPHVFPLALGVVLAGLVFVLSLWGSPSVSIVGVCVVFAWLRRGVRASLASTAQVLAQQPFSLERPRAASAPPRSWLLRPPLVSSLVRRFGPPSATAMAANAFHQTLLARCVQAPLRDLGLCLQIFSVSFDLCFVAERGPRWFQRRVAAL